MGKLKPGLQQDSHLLFLWTDDISINIYELQLPRARIGEPGLWNVLSLRDKKKLLFCECSGIRVSADFMSKWSLWHCCLDCLEREDEPRAMHNHSGHTMSDSIRSHWSSSRFCPINVVKSPLSLFVASRNHFLVTSSYLTVREMMAITYSNCVFGLLFSPNVL